MSELSLAIHLAALLVMAVASSIADAMVAASMSIERGLR